MGWDSAGRLLAEDLAVDFAGRRGRMLNFSPMAELCEVGGELSPSLRYQARPAPAVSLEFQTWSSGGDLVHGAAGDGGVGFGVGDGGSRIRGARSRRAL